ncbi:hypothetical protein V5N11_002937 [Cardamine amara subsp. amara]|uniref:Retrotransposon Copia-like N-terminal domain-containing protein n=1 Tax=Cardamine amara subsp. amara TaxID=228776 RepID=A0ABD0ZVQ5_CARAN
MSGGNNDGIPTGGGVLVPTTQKPYPYMLSSSDNSGSLISAVVLNRDNYIEWATEMRNALQAKRKIGFIDGLITKPVDDSPDLENWMTVNSMIIRWIRTLIEAKVMFLSGKQSCCSSDQSKTCCVPAERTTGG